MKNYVLATASALVFIMMSGANATSTDTSNANATDTSNATSTDTSTSENIVATPTAEEGAMAPAGKENKGMKKEGMAKKEAPCGHKHHGKRHHKHRHHAMPTSSEQNFYMPVVQPCGCETTCESNPCEATTCEGSVVTPQYYGGNQANPYWYAGGYFWYPHSRADVLTGYQPLNVDGMYWYPSRLHPHAVYVEKAKMVYTYPRPLQARMAMEPR